MRRITLSVLALSLVGATSCVAYDDPGYQNPPGTPTDYRSQPDPYRSAPPPPPPDYGAPSDNRGDYQQPYDSRYPGGYDDPYRSPSSEAGFFYQELSPFGEWVFTYDYGWAWYPRNVQAGWRPYYYGRWVPCDYGWMWVSYEPFGWATYHYGRWAYDVRLGWIWVPGRTWGPAWVSWQYGQGYTGWAPLPPEVGFEVGFGLRIGGFSLSVGIQPQAYTFVGDRYFLENEPYRYAQPVVRNTTIIQNTTNITNYTYVDNRVINKGVEFDRVERATGKRVRPLRVAETTNEQVEKVTGDEVVVYKAPKTRIETVQVDDSKPRHKGIGRERREARDQQERRERQPSSAKPEPDTQAQDQRRAPRAQEAPATPPADLEVAPRARQENKARNEEQVQKNQAKEQQELRAYQRQEQQRLDQVQREEKQKARAKNEADAIDKKHAEERQALVQEQKQAEQQLTAKQEVERKAVKAKPPGKDKADEKKGKDKDKGKKKPQAEEPPPPHR